MNKKRPHPGEVLARLMKAHGDLSDNEVARRSGVPQPTVTRIRKGESKDPTNDVLEKLARCFGVSLAQMRGEEPIEKVEETRPVYNVRPAPDVRGLQLVSSVQAGKPLPVIDPYAPGEGHKVVYTTKRVGPRAYALRIEGDSMENPNGKPTFPDGCIVVVDPDKPADIGKCVVVRFERQKEATFKQLAQDAGVRYLKPLNPRYPMIKLDERATLCGTWVQTIIDED